MMAARRSLLARCGLARRTRHAVATSPVSSAGAIGQPKNSRRWRFSALGRRATSTVRPHGCAKLSCTADPPERARSRPPRARLPQAPPIIRLPDHQTARSSDCPIIAPAFRPRSSVTLAAQKKAQHTLKMPPGRQKFPTRCRRDDEIQRPFSCAAEKKAKNPHRGHEFDFLPISNAYRRLYAYQQSADA